MGWNNYSPVTRPARMLQPIHVIHTNKVGGGGVTECGGGKEGA